MTAGYFYRIIGNTLRSQNGAFLPALKADDIPSSFQKIEHHNAVPKQPYEMPTALEMESLQPDSDLHRDVLRSPMSLSRGGENEKEGDDVGAGIAGSLAGRKVDKIGQNIHRMASSYPPQPERATQNSSFFPSIPTSPELTKKKISETNPNTKLKKSQTSSSNDIESKHHAENNVDAIDSKKANPDDSSTTTSAFSPIIDTPISPPSVPSIDLERKNSAVQPVSLTDANATPRKGSIVTVKEEVEEEGSKIKDNTTVNNDIGPSHEFIQEPPTNMYVENFQSREKQHNITNPPAILPFGVSKATANNLRETIVNVTIGRIEVRASTRSSPSVEQKTSGNLPETPKAFSPPLSLSEYLKRRSEEGKSGRR